MFFFQAEDGIRDLVRSRGLGDVYKRQDMPRVSSTKSLSGHSLGAAGVQEAIYALLMMRDDFICASANIESLDPEADGMPIVRERVDGCLLYTSDAADERSSVDLGGRRLIKKKEKQKKKERRNITHNTRNHRCTQSTTKQLEHQKA